MAPAYKLCGLSAQQRDNGLCLPQTRHFSLSLDTTGTFQAATPMLHLRGSESEQVSPFVGSIKGTASGSSSLLHQLNPTGFCSQRLWGLIFLALKPWARGAWCEAGTPHSKISLLNFYPPHVGVGPACSMSATLLPVWMDMVSLILQLSDFHSTRFPTVLSDYIFILILTWLCERTRLVCLRRHLDWKKFSDLDKDYKAKKRLNLCYKPAHMYQILQKCLLGPNKLYILHRAVVTSGIPWFYILFTMIGS